MKRTSWMLLSWILTIVGLVNACKPAGSSSVKAIVGDDNGKEKAMAIVGMRNSVEFSNVDTQTDEGKLLLQSIYEIYFGLVQCDSSTVGGKKIGADIWMNIVEFYSFAGVLYLDKERNILVFNDKDGKKTPQYFPCGVVSAQLLTAPMLLSSAAAMDDFPLVAEVPAKLESKYKDVYLLVQSIYLALRGPYSEGEKNPASLMAATVSMASESYPDITVTDSGLAKAMASADPYYNPCSKIKVNDRPYLQKWRLENYDCVSSSTDKDVKNFRPSSKLGFSNVRSKLQAQMTKLSAALRADAGSSSIEQARRVLRSTTPWNKITGVDASLAQSFCKGSTASSASSSGSGFSLAGSEDYTFSLPAVGAVADRAEFGSSASAGFGLTDAGSSTDDPSLQPFVRNLIRLFQGSDFSPYHPNFMANPDGLATVIPQDAAKAKQLVEAFRKSEGDLFWDYGKKMTSAVSEADQDRLFQEYRDKAGQMEATWLSNAKAIVLDPKTYSEQGGMSSVNSGDGGLTFRRGENLGSTPGSTRVYSNLGPTKVGDMSYHMYKDMTAPKLSGGTIMDRQLFRDASNPSIGGQRLTTPLGTFSTDWKANNGKGDVGYFTMNPNQVRDANREIGTRLGELKTNTASSRQQGNTFSGAWSSLTNWGRAVGGQGVLAQVNSHVQNGESVFGRTSANNQAYQEVRNANWEQGVKQAKAATYDTVMNNPIVQSGVGFYNNAKSWLSGGGAKPAQPTAGQGTRMVMTVPVTSGLTSRVVPSGATSTPTTTLRSTPPNQGSSSSGGGMRMINSTPMLQTSGSGR